MPICNDFLTIAEAARLIQRKSLSPVELTRMCLDRVDRRTNGSMHLSTSPRNRRWHRHARPKLRLQKEGPKGPLHGLPIGFKDVFNTKGIATTAHSYQLIDHVPAEDAAVVERLAAAGTVMMGKWRPMHALRRRRELIDEPLQAMEGIDLLVSATQPGEAPESTGYPSGGVSKSRATACLST